MSPAPAPAALPDREALEAALAALEPHASRPDTGALHDPIYMLLTEGEPASLVALRDALARHRAHPAAPRLHTLLGDAVALPPRTLADVLAAHGPPLADTAVADVERRLARAAERERILRDRVQAQEQELDRVRRNSEALAAAGALLAVAALVGWLGALDLWTITWIEPATPPADIPAPAQEP